ncbi:MAG: hypothetical protein ACHQTF_07315 [Gemmatimonadales bacterium]|jgi:hypothetical protein
MATLSQDKPTDAIAALLQERQRYEQWLTALESRRATTSSHVYARVYADYESRLGRVLEELGGRSAELRQVVDTLTERVNTLQTEENGHRDIRAEAELRAAVGEYSPEQWREVSQTSEADIARIAAHRAEAASELAQVQQLLNMATATSRRPDPVAAPSAVALAGGAAGEPTAQGSGRPAPRGSGAAAAAPPESFDELAFLHSVVEPKDQGTAPAPVPAGPPARSSAQTQRAKTPAAPPAVAPTAAGTARPAAMPAESPAAGEARQAPEPATVPAEATHRQPSKTDPVPLFLRDVPVEQIKTLKCAECGNMNYPTEWYCERCGGELAAM